MFNINNNQQIHMELFKKGYNNEYHPFLINVIFNLCDIISKRNFLPYGKMAWKIVRQFTNVNHSCPFTVKTSMQIMLFLHIKLCISIISGRVI